MLIKSNKRRVSGLTPRIFLKNVNSNRPLELYANIPEVKFLLQVSRQLRLP